MAFKRAVKTGVLTCIECGCTGRFPITSPAAPVLSMCEAAAPKGWSYAIGFFAMLTGDHQTRCPACTRTLADKQPEAEDEERFPFSNPLGSK